MDGLYVLSCVVYRVYKRDILVMKNLQIWGTGWAASWAFFKVIERTQGMTNISFHISSFGSANSFSKRYKLKTKYMIM